MRIEKTVITVIFLSLLFVGCSTNNNNSEAPEIVSVSPAQDETEVPVTTDITVTFNESMDVESCQTRFALYQGEYHQMPAQMNGMHGQFHWSDDRTQMIFSPDSMLMDSSMYSIMLQEGIRMHHHGGGNSMMGPHMDDYGDTVEDGIITRFTTAE